ncbi:hypothetical protein WDW37_21590 [Bdellovibrionota bacterium FG-1]
MDAPEGNLRDQSEAAGAASRRAGAKIEAPGKEAGGSVYPKRIQTVQWVPGNDQEEPRRQVKTEAPLGTFPPLLDRGSEHFPACRLSPRALDARRINAGWLWITGRCSRCGDEQ